jgi:hypothetical protein
MDVENVEQQLGRRARRSLKKVQAQGAGGCALVERVPKRPKGAVFLLLFHRFTDLAQ